MSFVVVCILKKKRKKRKKKEKKKFEKRNNKTIKSNKYTKLVLSRFDILFHVHHWD
jgi:hypothetical protein